MEMAFMNTESSKTDKPHRFVLDLPQGVDLRAMIKYVPVQNVSIYYTCKKVKNSK